MPEHSPQPAKAKTRLRFRTAWAVVLLASAALVFWQRDAALRWALLSLLQDTPVAHPEFSGARFGTHQAQIGQMQFTLSTPAGALTTNLRDIRADYELAQANLKSLHIAQARLDFRYADDSAAGTGEPETPALPLLPVKHIVVDSIDLNIDSHYGPMAMKGRIELRIESDNTWSLTLEQPGYGLHATLSPDLKAMRLTLKQASGQTLGDAKLEHSDPMHWQLEFDASAGEFLQWLASTELVPAKLRQELAASPILQAPPDTAGMEFKLTAHSGDNLQHIAGRGLLTRRQDYLASAELAVAPGSGQVDIDGHLDLAAAELFASLKPWLPAVVDGWRFSAGEVMATFRLKQRPKRALAAELYLNGHRLTLNAGPVSMQDGYLRLDVKTLFPLTVSAELDAPDIVIGKDTKLNGLQVKAGLKDNTLTLQRATLPAMGGMLEIVPAELNIEQRPLLLTLGVRNLNLAQLLNSLDYPPLSGTGTIDGKLPLSLDMDSIEVVDGKLLGSEPGVLRYQAPGAGDANLAFKALRNLHYRKLQATVNYRPSGDYSVGLRLEGKNPEVLSGHAVAFNLNLNGHLPDLLQKGIMAGDFEKPILEQVKTGVPHPDSNYPGRK